MSDAPYEVDETLASVIRDLRHPLVDAIEAEEALGSYIQDRLALAFSEGVRAAGDAEDIREVHNPYGDPEACTCGYGGVREPLNAGATSAGGSLSAASGAALEAPFSGS